MLERGKMAVLLPFKTATIKNVLADGDNSGPNAADCDLPRVGRDATVRKLVRIIHEVNLTLSHLARLPPTQSSFLAYRLYLFRKVKTLSRQ